CSLLSEPVFVMEAAQDWACHHTLMLWQSMAVCMECNRLSRGRLGKTRPQRHMRAARVVMPDPLSQQSSQMIVGKGNDVVQSFPPKRSKNAFTNRIGLRRAGRRFQDR